MDFQYIRLRSKRRQRRLRPFTRYVRGDLATFTCTGCEKISRKTRGGNKGKKDASAVAQKTDEGYVLMEAACDEEHKCWALGFRVDQRSC